MNVELWSPEAYGHDFFQSGWDWPLSRLDTRRRLEAACGFFKSDLMPKSFKDTGKEKIHKRPDPKKILCRIKNYEELFWTNAVLLINWVFKLVKLDHFHKGMSITSIWFLKPQGMKTHIWNHHLVKYQIKHFAMIENMTNWRYQFVPKYLLVKRDPYNGFLYSQ